MLAGTDPKDPNDYPGKLAVTPTPTPTPGFEALIAIAGLLAIVYLVLRKKRK